MTKLIITALGALEVLTLLWALLEAGARRTAKRRLHAEREEGRRLRRENAALAADAALIAALRTAVERFCALAADEYAAVVAEAERIVGGERDDGSRYDPALE